MNVRRPGSRLPLRPAVLVLAVLAAGAAGLWSAAGRHGGDVAGESPADAPAGADAATPPAPSSPDRTGAATSSSPASPSSPGRAAGVGAADRSAGLLSRKVPQSGTGKLVTVRGRSAVPGDGRTVTVRVQVERGIPIDGAAFARFVMATLDDSRSWSHSGARTFARTDARDADVRVVLASPDTSAAMCRPLRTFGRLSCRSGDAAVLTHFRWVHGSTGYGDDRTSYRRYVVNHEVGHLLGRGHVGCPGRGRLAPVMLQQTKGLLGCRPNPWPYP